MIKSTKIIAVDSKGGRRSRTGSFVSMGVTDREAIDCQDYFLDLADGEEPAGKVKKIELVIYYDLEEVETIETLRSENKDLKEFIESIDQPIMEAVEAISEVTDSIEGDLSTNGQAIKLSDIKCDCGEPVKWKNVTKHLNSGNVSHECDNCGLRTFGEAIDSIYIIWEESKDSTDMIKNFVTNILGEEWVEPENENLPPNQRDLKLYEKPCKCETSAIVNGKCANCGGVE